MITRLRAVLLVTACCGPAVAADPEENPFRSAKVGDFATYKIVMKIGGQALVGTFTETVVSRTDTEVKVREVAKFDNGIQTPPLEEKIDLTKPFDPSKFGNQMPGSDVKVEKGKEGKEKIKILGKDYDATWTTYRLKGKASGLDIDNNMKLWTVKGGPAIVLKLESSLTVAGVKTEVTMELTETGNKKPTETDKKK